MSGGGSSSSSDRRAGGGGGSKAPRLPLVKQHSWSPDTERDEAWIRRKHLHRGRAGSRLGHSVTDDDLDELRGCIDLGFGFGIKSPPPGDEDSAAAAAADRLCKTIPALDLYYSINRGYCAGSSPSISSSVDGSSAAGSPPFSIFSPGDSPDVKKARLKQWAQVVACSVRQRY